MSVKDSPRTILITGATGGIGRALAEVYAVSNTTLILQGRNSLRLNEVSRTCEAKGAKVISCELDIRDLNAYAEWLRAVSVKEVIDLAFINAGVNTNIGLNKSGERWESVVELLEVNVIGAMATVHQILPAMRARGHGQIALMSSLAGYFGLPITPSYSASKAAIKAYGESLRGWLAPEGIRVNVIMPGYVESQMCHDMPGPKPFLWTAQRAARHIKRKLAQDRARISFPFPLNLGTWFLSTLPASLSIRILRQLDYGG